MLNNRRSKTGLALTVSELVDHYLTRHAKKFKRSWREDERLLKRSGARMGQS